MADAPNPYVPVGSPNVWPATPVGPWLPIVDRPRIHSPMYAPPPLNHPPPFQTPGSLSESFVSLTVFEPAPSAPPPGRRVSSPVVYHPIPLRLSGPIGA